jgi:hypothetical protein
MKMSRYELAPKKVKLYLFKTMYSEERSGDGIQPSSELNHGQDKLEYQNRYNIKMMNG